MPSTATMLAGSIASSFALYVLLIKLTKQSEEAAQEAEPAASNEEAAASSSEQHQTAEDPTELLLSTKAELDRLLELHAVLRKAQDDADVTAVISDYTMLCSHTHEAGTEIKSKLPRRARQRACQNLERWGITYIEGAVSARTLAQMTSTFERVYNMLEERVRSLEYDGIEEEVKFAEIGWKDGGRVDVGLVSRVILDEKPFCDDAIVYNPMWWPVIEKMVGKDAKLAFGGVVLAKGGQVDIGELDIYGQPIDINQTWHVDGPHLFTGDSWTRDAGHASHLPPHIICVFVPLVDFTRANGPTEYHPGSHIVGRADELLNSGEYQTKPTVKILAAAGSAIMYDYRVLHRGTANVGGADRAMVYLTYTVPWYEDRRFYRKTSVMDDWACGSKELEEVSIFKESMDRWGDRVNNKSDDESDE